MENFGNILSLLTLLATFILGISDIKRRRAESSKLTSDSRLIETSADTQIMNQIKQASFDLVAQIKQDKESLIRDREELRAENSKLYEQIEELEARLAKCEKCLKELGGNCEEEK